MADDRCADEHDGMSMEKGEYVTSALGKYLIKSLLGKGGYGAVYKVTLEGSDKVYALKAEKKVARRDHTKLNMEVFILKSMADQPEEKSHYARIYDKTKKTHFYMIVMTLLGESLGDLKKKQDPPVFTPNTGYAAAIQCLEAVEELHKLYFIHRDLKPGNYAVGLPPRQHVIYILDFGIARRIVNDQNEIKAPRVKVPFKGTIRFAALASHESKELSYKDDCESWVYMVVDMMSPKGIPWKMEKTKEEVGDMKAACRVTQQAKERLFQGMAVEEFITGLDYLSSLHYTDKVNYEFLYKMVRAAASRQNAKMEPPFDWDSKGKTESEGSSPSADSQGRKVHHRERSGTSNTGEKSKKSRKSQKSSKDGGQKSRASKKSQKRDKSSKK